MLFDLRSRGRRRTVQATYLGLALLMGGGLVLFGVGSGVSGGGLLNGLGGGASNQKQVVSQGETNALKATRQRPGDPQAWGSLLQARWTSAGQPPNFDSSTRTFTTTGKQELAGATGAWQRYLQLTKHPDPNLAVLAARAYAALGDYTHEASAWETVSRANPAEAKGFECLAASAYAAHQTHKGDLASARAVILVPKVQQFPIKQVLTQAKTQPQIAQQC